MGFIFTCTVIDLVINYNDEFLVFICIYFILWMGTIIEPKSPEKIKEKTKYEPKIIFGTIRKNKTQNRNSEFFRSSSHFLWVMIFFGMKM